MYVLAFGGDWYFSGKYDDYQTPLCLHNINDERVKRYDARKQAQQEIADNEKLRDFKVKMAPREGTLVRPNFS